MICIYCNEKISNDSLACEFCKKDFSQEDQEIMLGIYRKRKHIKVNRFVLVSFICLCIIVTGLMAWLNHLAKRARIKMEMERQEFIAWCDDYFEAIEEVQVVTVSDTSALLRVSKKEWEMLSLNDRSSILTNLQIHIMKKRQETSLSALKYYTIQIDDEEGNILSMATANGQIILEFPGEQSYEDYKDPLELTDPLDW